MAKPRTRSLFAEPAPMVDDRPLIQHWRDALKQGRLKLREQYFARPQAAVLLHRQCRLVDSVVRALWEAFAMPKSLALVAVGGYGRGELFPYSDVDVLILRREGDAEDTAVADTAISR